MDKIKFNKLMEELKKVNQKREKQSRHSAWSKGVSNYTEELLKNIEDQLDQIETVPELHEAALNGAKDFSQYSWGGCSFIYDFDICEALCNNTEKKRTDNGRLAPNKNEAWLDVQARALFQAYNRIKMAFINLDKKEVMD